MRHVFPRALALALLSTLLLLPSGGPAAASPCGRDRPHSFRIGTFNTLQGHARFTPFAGIIGWQEVTDPSDRAKMRRQLGHAYRSYVPQNDDAAAIPISWRRSAFRFLSARSIRVHGGRHLVSPARYINVVHLRQRSTWRHIVFVNTHFVSEAFHPGSRDRWWRIHQWEWHRHMLYRVIGQIRHRHPKAALILVGDFNRNGYLDFSMYHLWPLKLGPGSHPKDHMYAGVPAHGGCVGRMSKVGSDHYRRRARIKIF